MRTPSAGETRWQAGYTGSLIVFVSAHGLANSRRRLRERTAAIQSNAAAPIFSVSETREVAELIHAELARLPERFRAPIVLCDLQEIAYEEAARVLGCPVGTVKSRLARGRERLRARLVRRGLAPSAVITVAPATRACVPALVRDATARAALRFSVHGPPSVVGTAAARAISLTEGMSSSLKLIRLKVAALAVALTGIGATAMAVLASSGPGTPTPVAGRIATAFDLIPEGRKPGPFPAGTVSKVDFEGNTSIASDKIRPKLLSRVGEPLVQTTVETDLKTLMGTRWFSEVRYYLDESPAGSGQWALVFVVREMPVLTKVVFRGRKAVSLKEIDDTTLLKAGNRADAARARLAIGRILRLYHEKGYDLAAVTLLEGGNVGDARVVIEIFEGPKVKIGEINIAGNHFASAAQLKTRIGTGEQILGRYGNYHSDRLDDDRQKLIDYYYSQGFFEVKVTPVTRPGAEQGLVDLTFVISEGTRYCVRKVIIEGNTSIRSDELRKDLELRSGKPFTRAMKEADKNRFLLRYGAIGFIDAQIKSEPGF